MQENLLNFQETSMNPIMHTETYHLLQQMISLRQHAFFYNIFIVTVTWCLIFEHRVFGDLLKVFVLRNVYLT